MTSPLDNLNPRLIWQHFDAIRQIPRPSKHEGRIAEHVVNWAKARNLDVRQDATGNVVVRVPATKGHESAPPVVLQGHLDMVPEKNQDVEFDFLTDAIKVRVEGDYVYATGTTLGSDNGIGVAAAMAVADDPAAVHGPLELLFTIDEETGLTGAQQLDPTLISGRTLLNLDTEEDAALYIGCAGGADINARFAVTRTAAPAGSTALHIAVRGLRGGHSGVDIHENRGNAVKFLARCIKAVADAGVKVDIVSLDGGSKHNAIPREADGVVLVPSARADEARSAIAATAASLKEEFGAIDPKASVAVSPAPAAGQPLSAADRDRVLRTLLACPHGVLAMSRAVPGLVETSNNLAVVATAGDDVHVTTSTRSSVMPSLKAVLLQVEAVLGLAGAEEIHVADGYPAWTPNPDSRVLKTAVAVFEKEFSSTPAVKAIHAGLECGLIGEKFPGMDMVSMGPQIVSTLSPDERVQISTVGRFYTFLKATLAALA